jgi:autotransporter-associated beta strand protein
MTSDSTRFHDLRRRLPALLALVTLALPAAAVDWSGLGADFNWTTPGNWVGGVAPASDPSTVVVLPPGPVQTATFVDAPFSINRLDVSAGYNIFGASITFVGTLPQLNLSGPTSVSAPLVVDSSLSIANDADQVLQSQISGAGDLSKAGPGRLTLATSVLPTGTLRIDGGILQVGFGGSSPPSIPGPVIVDSELVLQANGFMDIAAGVTGPGAVTFSGGTITGALPFAHTGSTTVDMSDVAGQFLGGGPLAIDSGRLTTADSVFASLTGTDAILVNNGTTTVVGSDGTSTTFTGSMSGLGGLTKVGAGRLTLGVDQIYGGTTNLDAGVLRIGDGTRAPAVVPGEVVDNTLLEVFALDSPAPNMTFPQGVSGSGALDLLGGVMRTGGGTPFTHTGATTVRSGAFLIDSLLGGGPLVVEAGAQYEGPQAVLASLSGAGSVNSGFVTVGSDNTDTTFTGPILGLNWTKVGTGRLTLSNPSMSISNIIVNSGTLRIGDGTTAPAALSTNFIVNGALEFAGPGTTDLTGTVAGSGSLTVLDGFVTKVGFDPFTHSGGTTVLGGRLAGRFGGGFWPLTIAPGARVDAVDGSVLSSLSGGGILDTEGTGVALFGAGTFTFDGVVSGTGPLNLAGLQTLTLTGASTATGGANVFQGTLVLTGSLAGPVQVFGGTLTGNGSIAGAVTVDAGATLSPGVAVGTMATGSLALAGNVPFDIAGPIAGTQHDRIDVTGTVTLTGAALSLAGGYAPVPGDSFVLIANDGADPVVGTFAGLPEGATLVFNGVTLRISYAGGTGNDVVLSAIPLMFDWSGLGGNASWSTSGNWIGGFAPPSASTTPVSFGAAGTTFAPLVDAPWQVNRIDLAGATPYVLGGAAITFGGASAQLAASGAAHVVQNALVLASTLAVSNASSLGLAGALSGAGGLAKSGAGTLTLSGASTHAGGTVVNAGTLLLTGSMPGPVFVNGGILGGTGSVAGPVTVNAAGALAPGLSPGVINTGNLVVAGALVVEVEGPAAGTQYDVTNVTGTVTIAGGTLQLIGAYVPVPGDVFTIVVNDAADAVAGAFAGMPEGGTVNFNGVALRISYVGGTGNDVTLTAASTAAPVPVPTLAQWAMILLAALVAGCGAWSMRQGRCR